MIIRLGFSTKARAATIFHNGRREYDSEHRSSKQTEIIIIVAGTTIMVLRNNYYASGSTRQEFIVTMDSGNSRNVRLLTNMPYHAELLSKVGEIYNFKPTTITISAPSHSAAELSRQEEAPVPPTD